MYNAQCIWGKPIKCIDTFFKKYQNQQLFFLCEKFSFSHVHFGLHKAQKIFLSKEKIFSLPIKKIFPPYQNFFLSWFLEKKNRYFFSKVWKPTIIFFRILTCIVFWLIRFSWRLDTPPTIKFIKTAPSTTFFQCDSSIVLNYDIHWQQKQTEKSVEIILFA